MSSLGSVSSCHVSSYVKVKVNAYNSYATSLTAAGLQIAQISDGLVGWLGFNGAFNTI